MNKGSDTAGKAELVSVPPPTVLGAPPRPGLTRPNLQQDPIFSCLMPSYTYVIQLSVR